MSRSRPPSPSRPPLSFGEAGPYVMLGWQIALGLVVFAAIGYALDAWLGTLPWFLIVGVLVGLVSIFTQIYRVAVDLQRKEGRRKRAPASDDRARPRFAEPQDEDPWDRRWRKKWDDRWPDDRDDDWGEEVPRGPDGGRPE